MRVTFRKVCRRMKRKEPGTRQKIAAPQARVRKLPLLFFSFFAGRRYSGTRQKTTAAQPAAFFFLRIADACVRKLPLFLFFFSGRRYSGTRQKKLRQWSFSGSSNDRFQKLLVIVSGLRR